MLLTDCVVEHRSHLVMAHQKLVGKNKGSQLRCRGFSSLRDEDTKASGSPARLRDVLGLPGGVSKESEVRPSAVPSIGPRILHWEREISGLDQDSSPEDHVLSSMKAEDATFCLLVNRSFLGVYFRLQLGLEGVGLRPRYQHQIFSKLAVGADACQ